MVVTVENARKVMVELDVRKAMGPDGVSNWMMRQCSEEPPSDPALKLLSSNFQNCPFAMKLMSQRGNFL